MPVTGSGHLRSEVTFSERIATTDEYGNDQGAWVDRWTCRAQIDPKVGSEDLMAARLEGRQPKIIRVRQSPETLQVTADWMVTDTDSGTRYNVRAVNDPDEGNAQHGRWLDLLVEAGVALG